MSKILSHKLRSGLVLLLVALLFSLNPLSQDLLATAASLPITTRLAAATMPTVANCTLSGTTRTCNLWAKAGTISLPGLASPLTGWGYTDSATGTAQIPGPTLVINQGETLKIVLTNSLSQPTGLSFPNQDIAPELSGAASGGSKTYTFTANTPGTSLYEAALITGGNGARQVGMGLFGALVVRPSANPASAYGDNASVFASEAVMIFSELDPRLNAAPTSFDMHTYAPKYWLINGKAYPNTTAIPGAAGSKVLLRYLNAGFYDHSIGSLGLRQTVLGQDGRALAHPYQVSAETLAAGQSMDLITTVPPGATIGTKFPLFSAANHLDNAGKLTGTNGSIVFGGMLTFLTVTTGGTGTITPTATSGPNTPTPTTAPISTPTATPGPIAVDKTGPVTSAVVVAPTPNNGSLNSDNSNQGLKITAKATDTLSSIVAVEAFIDNINGKNGTGIVFIPTDGVFNSKTETVYQYIALSDLVPLAQGPHTITVHSKDAAGNWGAKVNITLVIDRTPPTITTLTATKNGNNNQATLRLTAADPVNGTAAASNIVATEWFEGADPGLGKGTAATNLPGRSPSLNNLALTPNLNISSWTAGSTHTISVRLKDAAGNWSVVKTVKITK